jgi:segregation and condensation protein A
MTTSQRVEIPVDLLLAESWQQTLDRLTQDMDPWDIDVAELARRYRDHLHALQELQFELPGRMVLACSILLRIKSDDLLQRAQPSENDLFQALDDALDEPDDEWVAPAVPDAFALPLRRCPTRRVTLLDLRKAFASALAVSRRREVRVLPPEPFEDDHDPFEQYHIGGQGFTDRLGSLLSRIRDLLSGKTVVSFFRLLDRGDREERIERFFEILHLAAQGEIDCQQREFLGDIEITLSTAV